MLDKNNLNAFKNENLILQGNRSCSGNGLWDILITRQNKSVLLKAPTEAEETKQTNRSQSMTLILLKDKTAQDLAKYFRAVRFYPTPKTSINAMKRNHFVSWPGLTADLF